MRQVEQPLRDIQVNGQQVAAVTRRELRLAKPRLRHVRHATARHLLPQKWAKRFSRLVVKLWKQARCRLVVDEAKMRTYNAH